MEIATTNLNVSISQTMQTWIDNQIKAGVYVSASDYIRDLIRHDQRQREALQLALIEGEQSGVSSRKIDDIITIAKKEAREKARHGRVPAIQ